MHLSVENELLDIKNEHYDIKKECPNERGFTFCSIIIVMDDENKFIVIIRHPNTKGFPFKDRAMWQQLIRGTLQLKVPSNVRGRMPFLVNRLFLKYEVAHFLKDEN